jgi:nucleoside-diphosphate-sugar epimerase
VSRAVLITGASGFVGRAVARTLAGAGWRVTGLDLVRPDREPPSERGFAAFVTCDLLDERALAEVTGDAVYDAVVHLAGLLPGASTLRELFAVNVGGTSAALDRFVHPGCHLTFFSTGLVYGPQPAPFREDMNCSPTNAYARSKLAGETLVRTHGLACRAPVAILRPSVLYGTGAPAGMLLVSLMRTLAKGEPFAMTAGEQQRDFLHIDDAARAVAAVVERRLEGTWNLASGSSVSVRQAAELGAAIANRPELLRVGELPYRENEVFDYRLDAGALQAAAVWQPQIGLAAGLKRMWEEMS